MVYTVDGVNYTRRTKILVTGAGSGAQTDFQIKLAAIWSAAMQADFDDVRFTKADFQTLIDVWLESKVDSTSANIWVEFPNTPADGVEEIEAYMYFGNSGAASDWDIGATFLFGDDFPGSSLDTNIWDTTNIGNMVATVSGGELRCQCSTGSGKIYSKAKQYGSPVATRFRWKGWVTGKGLINIGFMDTALSDRAMWGSRQDLGQWRARTQNDGVATNTSEGTTGTGTYQNWDILWKSSSEVEYFRADASQQVTTTTVPDESDLHFLIFQTYQSLNVADAYFDWVFVRKYAANPPTAAFGTEEHQRRTPMMM